MSSASDGDTGEFWPAATEPWSITTDSHCPATQAQGMIALDILFSCWTQMLLTLLNFVVTLSYICLLYTSPSPRD